MGSDLPATGSLEYICRGRANQWDSNASARSNLEIDGAQSTMHLEEVLRIAVTEFGVGRWKRHLELVEHHNARGTVSMYNKL